MIEPIHRVVSDLVEVPFPSLTRASSFASCPDMAERLDTIFGAGYGDLFHAFPLSRKQIICAVLSDLESVPERSEVLRSNLSLCAERYLLKVRFGAYDARLHRFLEDIAPKCLLMSQYDPLWVLTSQLEVNLDSFKRGGRLDAAGISAQLPESINQLAGLLAEKRV